MNVRLPIIAGAISVIFILWPRPVSGETQNWFEQFKSTATNEELYKFLYALPKGGDLHNHLTGSNFVEWWYELATDPVKNGGYEYFTKTQILNCADYGSDMFGVSPYFLLFRNLQTSSLETLSECERREYKPIADLSQQEKTAWMNSLRLDKPHEGRDEFFQTHWQRLNDLGANPHINAEMMVKNMQAFAREGLVYLEMQEGARFYKHKDGTFFEPDEVVRIFKERLARRDAKDTGVTLKMQYYLLRFTDNAEQDLEWIYEFVARHNDLFVAINMVGREDNDKGYPLRFLSTLRKMRRTIPGVNLAIHAGEVDEPNSHVRDTLLLGATRIGHGINLIDDPDTMLLMRGDKYLVEINLISNLLLDYVDRYEQHPFPEYLRFGIPVALSTDDRGMWDSTMTDEYFVAVKEFNLSWEEVVQLGYNSIKHAFLDEREKQKLLSNYENRVSTFEEAFLKNRLKSLPQEPIQLRQFICNQYELCGTL